MEHFGIKGVHNLQIRDSIGMMKAPRYWEVPNTFYPMRVGNTVHLYRDAHQEDLEDPQVRTVTHVLMISTRTFDLDTCRILALTSCIMWC